MDIPALFQRFENGLSAYSGDDPLDHWNRFVEYLGKRVAADDPTGLSFVLERLVERFLHDERYANDVRYVNHCIKFASYYTEPISMYTYIYSKGVGTRAAQLYVAWAQQFEKSGALEQADAVYQRAVENQAQPADAVLQEYRQFQMRNSKTPTPLPATSRLPLQTSQFVNQMPPHKETALHCEGPTDCSDLLPADKTIRHISRSENLGVRIAAAPGAHAQTVSAYQKEPLECEESELSFEEVRAARYFLKIREEEKRREFEEQKRLVQEKEEKILKLQHCLDALDQELGGPHAGPPAPLQVNQRAPCPAPAATTMPPAGWSVFSDQDPHPPTSARPAAPRLSLAGPRAPLVEPVRPSLPCFPPTSNRSLLYGDGGAAAGFGPPDHPSTSAQRQHGAPEREFHVEQPAEAEPRLDTSQGATASFSHITPNTSLGLVSATPSRVLPSPTVNTREALDVIMDMFQAPTLLDDHFNDTSLGNAGNRSSDAVFTRNGAVSFAEPAPAPTPAPAPATPFTIYQDHGEQENPRVAAPGGGAEKPKAARALVGIPVSSSDRPSGGTPELAPDESTMWALRYNSLNSLAACPNSTRDFECLAQLVSTPSTSKAQHFTDSYNDQENDCQSALDGEGAGYSRQPKKLSPIIEQSPSEETFADQAGGPKQTRGGPAQHGGTITGEALSLGHSHSGLTTVVQPPPGVLSFRDHTLGQAGKSPPRAPGGAAVAAATTSSWSIFTSPVQPPKPDPAPPQPEPQEEDPRALPRAYPDVAMSPECAPKPDWLLALRSPEAVAKPDLDAFLSPPGTPDPPRAWGRSKDVAMTPGTPRWSVSDVSMSPAVRRLAESDDEPMSPDRGATATATADVAMMSPRVPGPVRAGHRVEDPWDEALIADFLSALSPPLTANPHCIRWQCNVPNIAAKTTITMGQAALRVDCLLGEGAFAKVYQATDPMTSEKMVVKVQKPANPWEFYINTQLDGRLPPAVRHLYSSIQSAHLFHNGSILLAELHRCGTLLHAVNLYKQLSDKVMPQPLVMYFTACMLHMVEQLHRVRLVHADIKPDNILLGERFLESQCLDPDVMEHGMVLVDMGQSIDMDLFPAGTEFTARCLTSGFQCTEMLSGRPWSYQTDYFGMAGTLHCMLFGTYMQVTQEDGVWKTNAVFRRNPHSELWLELFHTLLNIQDGRSLPCLRSLRCRLSAVLRDTYSNKLLSLKNRLVVLLLENMRTARR